MQNIFSDVFLVKPKITTPEYNKNHPIRTYNLVEGDSLSKNKLVTLTSSQTHELIVFICDYQKQKKPVNSLVIFNNSAYTNHRHKDISLKKVPDYLIFFQHENILYTIIAELKSNRMSGLPDKFRNGLHIAKFIGLNYDDKMKVKYINLLFRLPKILGGPLKPLMKRKENELTYHREHNYFEYTSSKIHFNKIIELITNKNKDGFK